ncbi:transposase domain-containing protein [Streptomyces atratus]|uniref:transposase domain-containing protein n=1 Tax=Streptomyces atratus TaxID=1893 RepID=UPI0033C4756F
MFTDELVDAATAKHGRAERRRHLLPTRLLVYFVLALCLFARESSIPYAVRPGRAESLRPGHTGVAGGDPEPSLR